MPASEGGYCIRITTNKTGADATLPISDEALELCGPLSTSGRVFKGFQKCMTQQPLKEWIKQAGITKSISFHCFAIHTQRFKLQPELTSIPFQRCSPTKA